VGTKFARVAVRRANLGRERLKREERQEIFICYAQLSNKRLKVFYFFKRN
jgi:hypothetical protein